MAKQLSNSDFAEMNFFHFYRIDELVCASLRRFLSQIIQTSLDDSKSVVLVQLSDDELYSLSRAYRDILIGYEHPRKTSLFKRYDHSDATLSKIFAHFPRLSRDLLRHENQ